MIHVRVTSANSTRESFLSISYPYYLFLKIKCTVPLSSQYNPDANLSRGIGDEAKREEADKDGDGGEFDEFQDRTFPGMGDVTPREYALLKDTYSGDPFPMCASFEVRGIDDN